jgi:hypothetical protein
LPRIGGHHFRNLPLRLEFELDQRPFQSERPRKEEMLMKKIILAAVAAAALCVPAVAQQSGQTQPGSASSQAQNASRGQNISPRELSARQVQQIQQSLDDKGFKSGKVDG